MKSRVLVGCMTATALALSACGGDGGAGNNASDAETTLTWSMWVGSTEDQNAMQSIADQVNQDHPDIEVTLQGSPFIDYWTKLSTQMSSGEAACIVSMQSLRLSQFADGLLPLDDLIEAEGADLTGFETGALENLAVDGQQYALPYDNGPIIAFYNADLWEAAGLEAPQTDWTVEDFEAAGAALAADGIPLYANTTEDIYLEGLAESYNGGSPISADGDIDVTDPKFVEAVEWVASLVEKGWATRADGADATADDNAFLNGRVALTFQGPWVLLDIHSKANFTVGLATLPAGPGGGQTISAGSGFGISKDCSEPEAAFKAIVSMTGEEVLTNLAEQGRAFPARTDSQPAWMDNASEVIDVETVMDAAQATSVPAPSSAKAEQFNQLMAQYGAAALNGDKPAAEVMAEIQAQIS